MIYATGLRALAYVAGIAMLAIGTLASADPPSRVARLGYISGAVSFSPAGENDWVHAVINRPLTNGDRLWSAARARAEIQIGGVVVRMGADTGLSILNLDDRIVQLQLTQGTLNVRVRRVERNQVVEVDTPNLAFTLGQPGEYRISVAEGDDATTIVMRKGQGEVYGNGRSYRVDSRSPYRFTGSDLGNYEYLEARRMDEFDRWANDRDRRYDTSGSARYVSPDVIGYEDLDTHGNWRSDPTYGNIWFPTHTAGGWAPYRDGHWSWIQPWGWTWIDDAPWGYAVSHYGRWTSIRGAWGWVPGPVRTRAYYAPALVAFVGGDNFQVSISSGNVSGVAWFPLAPREIYRPSYVTSRAYLENVNSSNTVINNYNYTNVTNIVYANRQVAGAIVAVPATAFVQSKQVSRAAVPISREVIATELVIAVPRVAPTASSVRGAAAQGGRPPGRTFERPVLARSAPPVVSAGFADQQPQLAATAGKPLEERTRSQMQPAATAPLVKLITPAQVAPPKALPPRIGAAEPGADRRTAPKERDAPPQSVARPAAVQAAPFPAEARPPGQRGRDEQRAPPVAPSPAEAQLPGIRGRAEQRSQPVSPPPAPPQRVVPRPAAQPPIANPAPAIAQPEQRPGSEQRGKNDRRPQPGVPAQPESLAQPGAQPSPPANVFPAPAANDQAPRGPASAPNVQLPRPQPVPRAQPPELEPKSAPGKAKDKKKDGDDEKPNDENRKKKD